MRIAPVHLALPAKTALRLLRLGLLVSAVGWGISFFFAWTPWAVAADQLDGMGAGAIEYRPLLDYWMRMAGTAFGCLGIVSALACLYPQRFISLIALLGPFHYFMGITLAVSAFRNQLEPSLHPTFIPDIVFCFLVGTLISVPMLRASLTSSRSHSARAHSV